MLHLIHRLLVSLMIITIPTFTYSQERMRKDRDRIMGSCPIGYVPGAYDGYCYQEGTPEAEIAKQQQYEMSKNFNTMGKWFLSTTFWPTGIFYTTSKLSEEDRIAIQMLNDSEKVEFVFVGIKKDQLVEEIAANEGENLNFIQSINDIPNEKVIHHRVELVTLLMKEWNLKAYSKYRAIIK